MINKKELVRCIIYLVFFGIGVFDVAHEMSVTSHDSRRIGNWPGEPRKQRLWKGNERKKGHVEFSKYTYRVTLVVLKKLLLNMYYAFLVSGLLL